MSGRTKKRKRQVKKAKAKRRKERRKVLATVQAVAAAIDEQFGTDWRDDPLLVAKFEAVVAEEMEAAKHRGIVVVKGKPSDQVLRLHDKVFGPPDPRLVRGPSVH